MLPFLLDDVARMHHDDLVREAKVQERSRAIAKATNSRSLPRRVRVRSGRLFMIVGAYLIGSGSAAMGVQLDRAT
jgi:hypothetical protein